MKNKLTPWFSMDTKPVNVGVYQVKWSFKVKYRYYAKWNGKFWCYIRLTPSQASTITGKSRSCYNSQIIGWRGLTRG